MWNKKTQEQKNFESLAKYESLIVYYTELKKNLMLEMDLTHEEKPKFQGVEKSRIALSENPRLKKLLQNRVKDFLGL